MQDDTTLDRNLQPIRQPIKAAYIGQLRELAASGGWQTARERLLKACAELLARGYARDVLDVLTHGDDTLQISHLRARALTNTGAPRAAAALLRSLLEQKHRDPETLGLLGRAEKDLARRAHRTSRAAAHWTRAFASYDAGFKHSRSIYVGINAASLALKLGQTSNARALADRILRLCDSELDPDHWTYATKAEAYLVLGEVELARMAYRNAVARAGAQVVSVGSMLRQAREVLQLQRLPTDMIDDDFQMPNVAVFAGHRLSDPRTGQLRFDAMRLGQLAAKLEALIESERIGFAYAAAADGADIVFLEALQKLGVAMQIVLPVDVATFRTACVCDDAWRARFDDLIEHAAGVTVASDGLSELDESALVYANEVMLGMARLNADEACTEVIGISVWDEAQGAPGGTADSIAQWRRAGLRTTNVHPRTLVVGAPQRPLQTDESVARPVMAMVFADVVGFASFSDAEIAEFFRSVQTKMVQLGYAEGRQPLVEQSFGDALYYVYAELAEAADFALALQRLADEDIRLGADATPLRIRVSVHAGPLTPVIDAVTGRQSYSGRHASRAARVEPVSSENQVLTTQQFAALLAARGVHDYELVYAGERMLPKNFGVERLYVLHGGD